jgi:iron complex transport system substrate-binding protein
VVALVPSLTEVIMAIGAEDHLVARTDYDTHSGVLDLPSVGGGLDPSLERLVDLDVELVLMPEGRRAPALALRLGELGMEALTLGTNTLPELHGAIRRLGELLGEAEAADSLSGHIEAELSAVGRRLQGRPPVAVMYVIAAHPPMTTGPGTFVDTLISLAGGRNVFEDAAQEWPTVGFESIVARDPEVIVWSAGAPGEIEMEALREASGWRDVPAVQAGRVVFVDGNLFNRPGPRLPEAVRLLARGLHPGAFRDKDSSEGGP